ncbi:calcitonin gene-related peptide type 1 receptor-like [Colias croceus]|uniref:calcitonin gene-related peptide type 1 receptor-like n=1 Tax=Colias crocea TaxID=72248 RepID=UPI001E27CE8B|nr:calcitonin gene-related peptide type 1 receptor-like [Colias croceus]
MSAYCRAEVILSFLWIFATVGVVEAYFSDGLNPVRVDLSVWHQRNPRVALRTNDQLACEKPNIYICEEPPNTISSEIGKTCNFRNVQYHEQVYRWVAGRGCLLYTPDFLFVNGSNPINLNAGCVYGNLFAPCLEVVKDDGTCGCFPFDPSLEEVANTVRNALIPSAHGRWEKCFYEASDCCSHFMEESGFADFANEECPTTFDGWTCWQPATKGTTASAVCSEFAYSNSGPSCHHFSTKKCFQNGTWELQTDYTTCSITPRLLSRYRFYIGMLSFSVIFCIPAIFIFFFYKRLRITRVVMHRNLLIAIVIRNLLVIIGRSEIYMEELKGSGSTAMSRNSVLCRILSTGERVAAGAVFAAMLLEGLYLHRLIVAVFRRRMELAYLYVVAAVIAILPAVVWAIIMALYNDHSCWVVYTVDHVQWILDGPRIMILVVNTVLFFDVLRVLLTKIRNTENANQLSTVKATLFLMPVFGTQFIFTAIRPTTSNCLWEQVYYFIAYTVEGLQGFVVALIYCYANREVLGLIKATYKKTESAVVSRIRGSEYPRTSVDPKSDRRFTYTTGMSKNNEDKDPYTYMKPKLHVAEIISIQASERLAEILDPVYETVDNGLVNSGYDFLDRSEYENDYNFTNASSVSIGCQDWLKRISPNSSIYNRSAIETTKPIKENDNEAKNVKESEYENDPKANDPNFNTDPQIEDVYEIPSFNDYENHDMLNEIIQYIESNERNLALNSELLAPNRKPEDKIVFVDQ